MNSKPSAQAPESSLSKATDQSDQSRAIIALGKKIVTETGLGDSTDTLGRWMAHYLAELLYKAEHSSDSSPDQLRELRDAIFAFWSHRHELPRGMRPFEEFEPILQALSSLDPKDSSPRYFLPSRAPSPKDNESVAVTKWIDLASSLDRVSKILIDYCLVTAADSAVDKSSEWVEAAVKSGIDNSFEFVVIRFYKEHKDLMNKDDPNADERRILSDRKQRLEEFLSMAAQMQEHLQTRLDSLPTAPDSENNDEDLIF